MLRSFGMVLSQCLEDLPTSRQTCSGKDVQLQDLYNERHRLALEELVSGGKESYLSFLKKEGIPSFLSDVEIQRIWQSAVVPECVSLSGDDACLEQSVSSSMNCSSVTYFPNVSDVDPPALELGWPVFRSSASRGVTRAVAHFQPSYDECIYSCKEAVRRMIKSAKKVIAIVTDSLTDLDILGDLKEACTGRRVPVYILLDQSCTPSFLQMCTNLNLRLDSLQHMQVRTISGATYFMRSGAKIVGKANERFMLIDGHRVATGSYRFNWTDGRLNSSNLIELYGQITENFDLEFRILYAQSLPLGPQALASNQTSSARDLQPVRSLLKREPHQVPVPETVGEEHRGQPGGDLEPDDEAGKRPSEGRPSSDTSTIVADRPEHVSAAPSDGNTVESGVDSPVLDSQSSGFVCSQTSVTLMDRAMQTDQPTRQCLSTSATQTDLQVPASCGPVPEPRSYYTASMRGRSRSGHSPDGAPSDRFQKLAKARRHHYSRIRCKLDHMVTLLSNRRELAQLTNLPLSPRRRKDTDGQENRASQGLEMQGTPLRRWTKYKRLK
uniref:Family with sequence similarity 83 member D n=1 Tax=Paramormyrops kingsleyae TaxID=1676925 RepID=A0A3B3RS75_9TELE|nr:protein FAM83D [Paramormyrops kingsleyae]